VDILRGAVGVVVGGVGSRICCSRRCADAVLSRPALADGSRAPSELAQEALTSKP